MKALVYEDVETLGFRDMPKAEAGEGEHLIRVVASGICGSDMHAYLGHDARRPAPLILGHEAAGVIEGGPEDGRRVTINPLVTCNTCLACISGRENLCADRQIISMPPREGAFAQYLAMPGTNLVTVPDDVGLAKAALAEPLAVSWHAARLALEALHSNMERRAIVIGGGAIGLAAALALRAMGVEQVTIVEPNEKRRAFLAERCGQTVTDTTTTPSTIVIDAVGYAATRALASEVAAPGGVIAHIGLGEDTGGLDVRRLTLQEITFIGTYTYTSQDFRNTAQAIFEGRLGPLDWIEERPLSDGAQAFSELRKGLIAAPKVILDPWV
ncbi:alcohol dehydrogenase catalytic domain-containing protein [Sulfitobacter mediterraneus]|uniref:alcohol dehydrogenase catalytic domain-containing protein n=1 Tax=Sulfitobacter mediterraneus TaxID=83219 RepID=UPI0019311F84|nr:alcohol dehydrogenase catalytic domain-containing protein [Sulfitobacter mediterraneus]MBM1310956.1 alcohol dehydrogenase catalytic domain-containing protein [Sulfitobacter mediterraneus]MBM1314839.1 alcohol dehydrogenase catalytic domain-containing protein [Sulfitobacter mediterraneus]MBM1323199.1 alcohol dehydrogenase catalytic domain-containing protein [Sulfitobacter mediterraneus]MBM1327111.1 alcohol dehydrogenase catalytic domain-containing protein [Sulfitobacter mediterraneus]MBM13984